MPLLNNIYFKKYILLVKKKKTGVGYKKLYQTLTSSGGGKKEGKRERKPMSKQGEREDFVHQAVG